VTSDTGPAIAPRGGPGSFLARITDAVNVDPHRPLPLDLLHAWSTPMAQGPDGQPLAPGVMDASLGRISDDGQGTRAVKDVMAAISAGVISDWASVEERLAGIRAAPALREFLGDLTPDEVTPQVGELFWQVARNGTHEEAVKWGILLGAIYPERAKAGDLLLLARHPEFTRYAIPALRSLTGVVDGIHEEMLALVPRVSGYASVYLVRGLLGEASLLDDLDIQSTLLTEGLRRGLKGELAVPLALRLDVDGLARRAISDDDTFEGMVLLVNALLYDSEAADPTGRWNALERVVSPHLRLLELRDPDVRVLSALQSLQEFLSDPVSEPLEDRGWRAARASSLLRDRLDLGHLAEAVGRPETRSLALHVIGGQELRELVPAVWASFETAPDLHAADTLAGLGDPEVLEKLRRRLPELVDLDARDRAPVTESPVAPDLPEHRMYAIVVRAMGRLATPEAVEVIRRAGRDFHPWGRAAACEAIAFLPPERMDDALRVLVAERLGDQPDYVAEEARRAAAAHGIRGR
jgi:hypothetical protein